MDQILGGIYRYHGSVRAQWFFDSPNEFGAFFATLTAWFLGWLTILPMKPRGWRLALNAVIFVGFVSTTFLMQRSMSRGALVGFGLSLITGWVLYRSHSRFLCAASAAVLLAVTQPHLLMRCRDVAQPDGGSSHRLLLWKATLVSSVSGEWNAYAFPDRIWTWFASPELTERYRNPVSTPLTLLDRHGYFGLWLGLTLVGISLASLHRVSAIQPFARAPALAITAFFGASLYTHILESHVLQWTCWGLLLCALAVVAGAVCENQFSWRSLRGGAVLGASLAAVGTASVYCTAIIIASSACPHWRELPERHRQLGVTVASSSCGQAPMHGALLWVCSQDDIPVYVRRLLTPLAQNHTAVTVLTYDRSVEDPAAAVRNCLARITQPSTRLVAGGSPEGVVFLLDALAGLATPLQQVTVWASDLDPYWPTGVGSVAELLNSINGSIILRTSRSEWTDADRIQLRSDLVISTIPVPKTDGELYESVHDAVLAAK